MTLNIESPAAERLAQQVAALTHETLAQAVVTSLEERLIRVHARSRGASVAQRLERHAEEYASWEITDDRPADEILGYDADGLPR